MWIRVPQWNCVRNTAQYLHFASHYPCYSACAPLRNLHRRIAEVRYQLLKSNQCAEYKPWWVVEQQTDTSLTPDDNRWGPGTSGQQNSPPMFEDWIGGSVHQSRQSFYVSKSPGARKYAITIKWFDDSVRNDQFLDINGTSVKINTEATPSSVRTRDSNPCP